MLLDGLKFDYDGCSSLPKYQRLANCLEEWIRENKLPPGTKFPGDRQLSEYLNTTPVTISKSLNELTRKGILERKVGSGTYIADASNPGPKYRRIGIICHEVIRTDPVYVDPVLTVFYDYWKTRGYQVVSLLGSPENYENSIREYGLAGIMVLLPTEEFSGDIRRFSEAGMPLVTVGGYAIPELPDISLGTDHVRTGELLVKYLHGLGHERIGFIADNSKRVSIILRDRGYGNGMWEAKLPVRPDWRICTADYQELKERIELLRRSPDVPTAYIIGSLGSVINVYNVMNALEIKIGREVSLISFDDADYLRQLKPSLTVFRQQIAEFTTAAASQLERMMRRESPAAVDHHSLEPVLLERGSCYKINEK